MKVIVIGASAGGINLLSQMLIKLPKPYVLPILIAQHMPYDMPDSYIERLNKHVQLKVKEASHCECIQPGIIYFAPAGYHLLVEADFTLSLSVDERVNYARPAIDVLFQSAAEVFQESLIAIVLTGANCDGVEGAKAVQDYGGCVWVQSPETAFAQVMPKAVKEALKLSSKFCLSPNELIEYLINLNQVMTIKE
ncbi:chemotaxis protein CheB [Thiotrichales bacterium 19X7-9]|nr:chemotaxis protein CheB [Thiotrichales bacterium 19X7-9]